MKRVQVQELVTNFSGDYNLRGKNFRHRRLEKRRGWG